MAQDTSDEWQFSATVYGWFPDIGGQTSFPAGAGGTIDVDVSTILDHLKMTAQGSFEVHKGHWGAFTDIVYLDVGEAKTQTRNLEIGGRTACPPAVTAAMDFDLKSTIWTFAGSYRVVDGAGATFDVLLGARLASFDQTLDWEFSGNFGPVTPPPLTGTPRRVRRSVGRDRRGERASRIRRGTTLGRVVPLRHRYGRFGSHLAGHGGLSPYAFGWGDLGVAWRYLDYDLGSDGPIADMNFNGPALGATFRW